jgi:hypothetical protein
MEIIGDETIRKIFPVLEKEERYVLKPLIHVLIGKWEADLRKSEELNKDPESFWSHGIIFPKDSSEGTEIKVYSTIPVMPVQARFASIPATCLGIYKLIGASIWRGGYDISLDRSDFIVDDRLYADPLGDAEILCLKIVESARKFFLGIDLVVLKEEAKCFLLAGNPSVVRGDMKRFYGLAADTIAIAKA